MTGYTELKTERKEDSSNPTVTQLLENNFESKCSMKVESNSRGYNTTVHVYEGCSHEQIAQTVRDTVHAHKLLQKRLKEATEATEETTDK